MSEIDLAEKFPDLQPINSAPSLFTINGCGLMLYGARDHDDETGTFIKTQCLTLLFLPILALRSFRVANAQRGWYFIGREPLSALARIWNALAVVGVLAAVGIGVWAAQTSSPGYVAAQKLERADELAADEKFRDAAGKYAEVIDSHTSSSPKAQQRLRELYVNAADKAPPEEAVALVEFGETLKNRAMFVQGLNSAALTMARRLAESAPRQAVQILAILDRLLLDAPAGEAVDPKQVAAARKAALIKLVKSDPTDVESAAALAVIYESEKNFDECRRLLEPHAARLGDTEGARILGQLYSRAGDVDKAHALLVPYCRQRLAKLHQAEESYDTTLKTTQEQIIAELKSGRGHQDFHRRLAAAPEDQKNRIVNEYLLQELKKQPEWNRAQTELRQASGVVPVALELGVVQLRRGRKLPPGEARNKALKQAEETFLAVRGVAGRTNEYRLNLGQVYYWLDRQKEGRKLFDKLLADGKRAPLALLAVAGTLRTLGETTEARKLAEEAYKQATNDDEKHRAAGLRSILSVDIDDRILWLKRCDSKELDVQADLQTTLARQAAREGRDDDAKRFLREAIAIYRRLPENAANLNNGALVWFQLFGLTGDKSDFETGVKRMEKAISLKPGDAVLIGNTGGTIMQASLQEIIGDTLDLKSLETRADISLLRFLYENAAQRKSWREKLAAHAGVKKAVRYLNNTTLLAPKRGTAYAMLLSLHAFQDDDDAVSALYAKLSKAQVDVAETTQSTLDYVAGKDLAKRRSEAAVAVKRLRRAVTKTQGRKNATYAVARASLSGGLVTLWQTEGTVDPDEIVRLAEDARDAAPSSAVNSALTAAYSLRAVLAAGKKNPAVAKTTQRCRRMLAPRYLLACLLSHQSTRGAFAGNADVQRIVKLIEQEDRDFPESGSGVDWAILRSVAPQKAKGRESRVTKKDRTEFWQTVLQLSPTNAPAVLELCWQNRIAGNTAEAKRLLDSLRKRGIDVPLKM